MFTGIIQQIGSIAAVEAIEAGCRFVINHSFGVLALGESIAVNGVCLTVTAFDADTFQCDISPETLGLTTLAEWQAGHVVNLERAMAMGNRFGGHMVSGHVDQTGVVVTRSFEAEFLHLQVGGFDQAAATCLVKKGSIAIDGVSLTINDVIKLSDQYAVSLMLVPHTLTMTTLDQLSVNSKVNVEFDPIAKMVAQQLQNFSQMGGVR
jgi:riboflavin synthase